MGSVRTVGSSPSLPGVPSLSVAPGSTIPVVVPSPELNAASVPVSDVSVTGPSGVPPPSTRGAAGSGLPDASVATAVEVPVAVFVTEPVPTSVGVRTYVAVAAVRGPSPTSSVPSNPASGVGPTAVPVNAARPASVIDTPARAVLPTFSTVNTKFTVSPASPNNPLPFVSATEDTDFTTSNSGEGVRVTTVGLLPLPSEVPSVPSPARSLSDVSVGSVRPGKSLPTLSTGLPVVDAVLCTPPASIAACVRSNVAVYWNVSPTSRRPLEFVSDAATSVGPVVSVTAVPVPSVPNVVVSEIGVAPRSRATSPVFSTENV